MTEHLMLPTHICCQCVAESFISVFDEDFFCPTICVSFACTVATGQILVSFKSYCFMTISGLQHLEQHFGYLTLTFNPKW